MGLKFIFKKKERNIQQICRQSSLVALGKVKKVGAFFLSYFENGYIRKIVWGDRGRGVNYASVLSEEANKRFVRWV